MNGQIFAQSLLPTRMQENAYIAIMRKKKYCRHGSVWMFSNQKQFCKPTTKGYMWKYDENHSSIYCTYHCFRTKRHLQKLTTKKHQKKDNTWRRRLRKAKLLRLNPVESPSGSKKPVSRSGVPTGSPQTTGSLGRAQQGPAKRLSEGLTSKASRFSLSLALELSMLLNLNSTGLGF